MFKAEAVLAEKIHYIFCSDEYLVGINNKFLKHNTLTDVITFPLSSSPVNAEIYISLERVKENAKIFDTKYETELLRVIIHGALHLCGYDDKRGNDKQIMRRKEEFYLNHFNVSREATY
ncbi:MAG: rRNA maturation RNase YbeY [Parafilimonas sp.]|nr:rRNA maturation RNase YbeY [Parafilimonas sp.]